jgi:glycosyltransferase involved in cell wall biosynthesis
MRGVFMKILIVSSDPIPHTGGKSTHVINLKEGLEKNGHEVIIFSPSSISKYLRWLVISIPIKFIKLLNKDMVSLFYKSVRMRLMSSVLWFMRKNYKIDVINCQDTFSVLAAKSAFKNTPIVLTMHTYLAVEATLDDNSIKIDSKVYEKLMNIELTAMNSVDDIVCVDSRIKEHVVEFIDKDKSKNLVVIPNFTNTDKFSITNEFKKKSLQEKYKLGNFDSVILSTRRLVEKNGVIYAVEAMKHVTANYNPCLLLAGNGPQKSKILKYINENHLENKVFLLGDISNEEITDLYSLADIVVIPSITINGLQEATSLSAIEAMSCGLPVVASNIGGLKELIVTGETGILVNEKNAFEIADQCMELLDNENNSKDIAKNARSFIVKNNSHINAAAKFYQIYKRKMK